jgi:hypothetical protein
MDLSYIPSDIKDECIYDIDDGYRYMFAGFKILPYYLAEEGVIPIT